MTSERSMFPDLFPDLISAAPFDPAVKLSADRRRSLRQRADVAVGRHPLVGGPVQSDPAATCGTCVHRVLVHWHNRTYAKCAFGIDPKVQPLDRALNASHSAASDVRAWWPGCRNWEEKA